MTKNQLELWKIKTECERLQKRFGDYDVFMKNQGNKENKIPIFELV